MFSYMRMRVQTFWRTPQSLLRLVNRHLLKDIRSYEEFEAKYFPEL